MPDSKSPPKPPPAPPPDGGGRRWLPLEPPPPGPPDAIIIPEGQFEEIFPDGLVEALAAQGAALDPRWRAARDAFIASMDARWGKFILEELSREIARQKDGAQASAKDLCQKVLLVLCRRYTEHVAQTGEAWAPDKPDAYLRSVAHNVARDHFKVKRRKPKIARGVELDERADAEPDPEAAMGRAQLMAIFERERENLTAGEADVFQGRVALEMTFPAIAAVLKRPLSTVYDQYRSAVAKLRAILARESAEPPVRKAGDAGNDVDARAKRRR